jgi:acyl-CoA thioesterase-1
MSKGRKTQSTVARPGAGGRRLLAAAWRAVAVALVCSVAGPVAARGAEGTHAILFFGDSLTAGYGLDNPGQDAYPAVIQRKLEAEHLPWRVINAGLSGETTAGGLRRIDWVLRQPVDIVVLALGANDGLRGIDPAVTERNLGEIVDHIRARDPAAKIIVAGMEMPPSMGRAYTDRFHALFARVAEQKHATLLPFLLEGVAGHPELNQADAIHPNPAGHRIVAGNVWRILRPLL